MKGDEDHQGLISTGRYVSNLSCVITQLCQLYYSPWFQGISDIPAFLLPKMSSPPWFWSTEEKKSSLDNEPSMGAPPDRCVGRELNSLICLEIQIRKWLEQS